jgi:hypothetical protein
MDIQQTDPYAAYGGQTAPPVATAPAPAPASNPTATQGAATGTSDDPYAVYGGQTAPAPAPANSGLHLSDEQIQQAAANPANQKMMADRMKQQDQAPAGSEKDAGYWHGVWESTLGPVFEEARAKQKTMEKMSIGDRLGASFKDAIEHTPDVMLYDLTKNAISQAYEEGKKAAHHAHQSLSEGAEAVKSLASGDTTSANMHGRNASGELLQAEGHGLAAAVPIVGPAAAKAGEDIGKGKIKEGLGEGSGVLAQVVLPELAEEGTAALASRVTKNASKTAELSAAEEAAAKARQTAAEANETATKASADAEAGKPALEAQRAAERTANQAQARTTIANSARGSAENTLDTINKTRGEVKGSKPIDTKAEAANVQSFGDAADVIQKNAKQIYDKLDEVSNGGFTNLREVMKANKQAIYQGDKNAPILQARLEKDMDALFEKHADAVGPNDLKAASAAWRTSKVLEDLHGAVEKSIAGAPESIATRAGTPREVIGAQLNKRLNKLLENTPQADLENAIGKDGVDNLYRVADLTSTPAKTAKLVDVATNVAKQLKLEAKAKDAAAATAEAKAAALRPPKSSLATTAKSVVSNVATKSAASATGAAVAHAVGIDSRLGAAAGVMVEQGTRAVLQRMLVSPRVGKLLHDAASVGASAKTYAPLITLAMRQEAEANNETRKKAGKK